MVEVKTEKNSEKADQEGEKLYFDSMKHLTTLNTGSVLLLVTFMEKFINNPRWRTLIAVSLVSFVISILCSVSSMFQSANHIKYSGRFRRLETRIKNVVYYFSLFTFLVGIVSLVIFALRNLY